MSEGSKFDIRTECFLPFSSGWEQPTADEVREILRRINPPHGLVGSEAARLLGIHGSRQIRRWTGGDADIPYAAWAILCDLAGVHRIWVEKH